MDTTLKAAREYLFNDRAWMTTGKSLDRRVNTCLLRALREISGEAPEALVPEDAHVRVYASTSGEDNAATISKTADLKVLKFNLTGTWVPTVDQTWDGVMHLEITDPNGRKRRRQSREWWYDAAAESYYVSIDRPWFDTGASTMAFRIYQPEFFLPGNTTKVLTPLRLFDDSEQLIGQISGGTARREAMPDYDQGVQGRPTDFWRGRFFQMPTPTEAPTVSRAEESNTDGVISYLPWLGPVQEGKFEFCYTWAWGRREQEWGQSTGNFADPVWESAPSPVSEPFDHGTEFDILKDDATTAYEGGRAVVIQCSNLEEMLDFMGDPAGIRLGASPYPPTDAPLRYGRSGVRLRVYVRRVATYTTRGPAGTATSPTIIRESYRMNRAEADEKFYLLAELNPLDQDKTLSAMTTPQYKVSSVTWQGGPINTFPALTAENNMPPDMSRQLRKVTGYYAYHLNPLPDQDYDIDISLLRQPEELVNDNDQLPIKQEAFAAFMELALAFMSRLDGVDQAAERKHRDIYAKLVRRFKSQHGDNNGIVENNPWGARRRTYRIGLFQEG
jgi:hypothetical protein